MNTLKTAVLLTSLTLLLVVAGDYFGGRNGMILAFLFAAVMNFLAISIPTRSHSKCTARNR